MPVGVVLCGEEGGVLGESAEFGDGFFETSDTGHLGEELVVSVYVWMCEVVPGVVDFNFDVKMNVTAHNVLLKSSIGEKLDSHLTVLDNARPRSRSFSRCSGVRGFFA